jgi:hypothetical protein
MARLRYRRDEELKEEAAEKFHHNVYMILLDPKRNPSRVRSKTGRAVTA